MRMGQVKQRRSSSAVPLCLRMLLLAREALGRSLDWGLWAGSAKRGVSGMVLSNRHMLRVGCPCNFFAYACIEFQTLQRRCPSSNGSS